MALAVVAPAPTKPAAPPGLQTISAAQLAQHNTPKDMWIVIDGNVYDVSKFGRLHPGGSKVLEQLAGNDVTTEFYELHRHDVLNKYGRLIVGRLDTAGPAPNTEPTGAISDVPFMEIPAFQGQASPYFTDSHKATLMGARKFIQKELLPIAAQSDLDGNYPEPELRQKLGMSGMFASRLGPGPWMKELGPLGVKLPGDVEPEKFDYFHEMICHQEIGRIGYPGFIDSLGAGWVISVPAVYNFGSDKMQKEVGSALLRGDKHSALAISEPFAGSDVAQIKCTAEKTADGKHYIVNGVKKWITEGCFSDYFVTAVRTGAKGSGGISMLLIERGEGVETKQIKTTYSTCAGTALVIFNEVKVPVENLLGKENDGFKLVMYNFNHERWLIVQSLLGQGRMALADTFMWSRQRKVFGKPLIDQPVIRNKLAQSVASLESVQSYNEALTYDMVKTKGGAVGPRLAGPIAMLKFQTTRMAWMIADNTVQILGGRGITRTGMGARVEGFKNYAKYAAVYGGSEEIMADLAIKQALKRFPEQAKL